MPTAIPEQLVSVMTPAFNAAETIEATLDSVWEQTYRPIEYVIVNDGSRDDTESIIDQWQRDKKSDAFSIIYHSQENQGLLRTRSRALSLSHGHFLQFLDADDLLHPQKFQTCIPILCDEHMDVVVPRTGKFFETMEAKTRCSSDVIRRPWTQDEVRQTTITSNLWHSVGPMFRRSLVEKVGDFPPDVSPFAEELEFHGRVKLATDRIRYLDEVLSFYRKGNHNALTGTIEKTYQGRIEAARIAMDLLIRHDVTRRQEWSSLRKMCFRTYYQSLTVNKDEAAQNAAWENLVEVLEKRSTIVSRTARKCRPLLDSLLGGISRWRKTAPESSSQPNGIA